jgi:hypothetical protein
MPDVAETQTPAASITGLLLSFLLLVPLHVFAILQLCVVVPVTFKLIRRATLPAAIIMGLAASHFVGLVGGFLAVLTVGEWAFVAGYATFTLLAGYAFIERRLGGRYRGLDDGSGGT